MQRQHSPENYQNFKQGNAKNESGINQSTLLGWVL